MRCGICGQESTTTHACLDRAPLSTTVPLAQEYNALHGKPPQRPDYRAFGEKVARVMLRGSLLARYGQGEATEFESRLVNIAAIYGIPLESPDAR